MPKFEVPETLDTLEGVPEKFQSLYVKSDDGNGYVFKDPKAAIEGMRRAKEERGELAEKVKDYESRFKDVDPDKYRSLLGKEKEFEELDRTNQGELDKIKTELRDKYEGQISAAKQQIIERDARYANRILDDQISRALTRAGATDKGAEVLARVLKAEVTTKMGDDGEPEFYILDRKTKKPRLNEDADPFTLDDLVAEQREDLPQLFSGSGASGSGASGQDKNVAAPSDENPSQWSDAQKKAYISQHGHAAYRQLCVKESARATEKRHEGRRRTA